MAGTGLIAIKRRIKSVTSTGKITKAMGLVATAKLRKTRNKLEVNDKYNEIFEGTMNEVFENYPESVYNVFTHGNDSKKKLYIVLTSDSGLCGGFNASVVKTAVDQFNKDSEKPIFILVGGRGRSYFNKYKYKAEAEYVDMPDLPTFKEASEITRKALDIYEKGEAGEVYIAYTQFVSTIKQVPKIKKLLPLGYNKDDAETEYRKFEPDVVKLVNATVNGYINQNVLNCMLNSKASEQGSRMSAMDSATKNADDILDNLNLQYNRIRQSAITQEITEIVAGAEAQS